MIIWEKDHIPPEQFVKIARDSNIILCSPEDDLNVRVNETGSISLLLKGQTNLTGSVNVGPNIVSIPFSPRIKMSLPAMIQPQFNSTGDVPCNPIYFDADIKHIYNDQEKLVHTIYENLQFELYINLKRLRAYNKTFVLNAGKALIETVFQYIVNPAKSDMKTVEEVYWIRDEYIFKEFLNQI